MFKNHIKCKKKNIILTYKLDFIWYCYYNTALDKQNCLRCRYSPTRISTLHDSYFGRQKNRKTEEFLKKSPQRILNTTRD